MCIDYNRVPILVGWKVWLTTGEEAEEEEKQDDQQQNEEKPPDVPFTVAMVVYGDKGKTEEYQLTNVDPEPHKAGKTSEFDVSNNTCEHLFY